MNEKNITIVYSGGEQETLTLNENLEEAPLSEILKQLDMREWDDIYGDVKANNENDHEEEKDS